MTRIKLGAVALAASLALSAPALAGPPSAFSAVTSTGPESLDLLPSATVSRGGEAMPEADFLPPTKPTRSKRLRRALRSIFSPGSSSPPVAEVPAPEQMVLDAAAMAPTFDPGDIATSAPPVAEPARPEMRAVSVEPAPRVVARRPAPLPRPRPADGAAIVSSAIEEPAAPATRATATVEIESPIPEPAMPETAAALPEPVPLVAHREVKDDVVAPAEALTAAPPVATTIPVERARAIAATSAQPVVPPAPPHLAMVYPGRAVRDPALEVQPSAPPAPPVAAAPADNSAMPHPSPWVPANSPPAEHPIEIARAPESAVAVEADPASAPVSEPSEPPLASAESTSPEAAAPAEHEIEEAEAPASDSPAHPQAEATTDEQPAADHGAEASATETDAHGGETPQYTPLPVATGDTTPRDLVQELQSLQDRIAQGSAEALVAQRTKLELIDKTFASLPPEVWQDRRNAAALVTYVLSGGRPTVLSQLLQAQPLPALDEGLMRGALAYVEGDPVKAKELLSGVDARNFPASMGSQLAIAQAALVIQDDPQRAAALLDVARLLSPGTLAEEAALRREILVVAQLQLTDKFETLSRQYVQRFRHSVYAGNFRQRFAAALTRMTFVDDPAQFSRLDGILATLEPEARRDVFLIIARAAVVQAKTGAARLAAERALATADSGTVEETRAILYRAAASVVAPEGPDAALADLKRVDRTLLDASDARLYAVVATTAEAIATASAPKAIPAAVATAKPSATDADAEANPAIARAEEAIKLADASLEAPAR